MNWERIEGNWGQFKGHVKKQWGKLTDDQLDVVNGQREILVGKIREAYGLGKEEAERQVDLWGNSIPEDDVAARRREDEASPRRPG